MGALVNLSFLVSVSKTCYLFPSFKCALRDLGESGLPAVRTYHIDPPGSQSLILVEQRKGTMAQSHGQNSCSPGCRWHSGSLSCSSRETRGFETFKKLGMANNIINSSEFRTVEFTLFGKLSGRILCKATLTCRQIWLISKDILKHTHCPHVQGKKQA